jgi:hypothetical protein
MEQREVPHRCEDVSTELREWFPEQFDYKLCSPSIHEQAGHIYILASLEDTWQNMDDAASLSVCVADVKEALLKMDSASDDGFLHNVQAFHGGRTFIKACKALHDEMDTVEKSFVKLSEQGAGLQKFADGYSMLQGLEEFFDWWNHRFSLAVHEVAPIQYVVSLSCVLPVPVPFNMFLGRDLHIFTCFCLEVSILPCVACTLFTRCAHIETYTSLGRQ